MMKKETSNEENTTTTTRENNRMDIGQLEAKSKDELMELAKEMELSDYGELTKQDLTMRLLQAEAEQQGNISRTADLLGVERSNLYKKMRGYGIAPARRPDEETP